MADLFSRLTIDGHELPNRIVLAPLASGLAADDGFAGPELAARFGRFARGGVGLLLSEPLLVTPPPAAGGPHVGAYADAFVPGLRQLVAAGRAHGAPVLLTLDAPAPAAPPAPAALAALVEAYLLAGRRAMAAGADGIMLTTADGGLLHSLLSPLRNARGDAYGGDLAGRLRLTVEVVEGIRRWLGRRVLLGCRILADELAPGGLGLQDARVVAKRLTAAGVRLLDVAAPPASPQVARFPGWAVPLASSIRRITDVPVIGSGLLGDPALADSLVRDGSLDLVMLGAALRADPDWPRAAREQLAATRDPRARR
jgi:2,4-dienoyl-CoA reductase-like NADH-dependent reductase (Old Yellow Enzyme family)